MSIQDFCSKWLDDIDWVEGLAIKVDECVWIYVIPKNYNSLTINQRRESAALGLNLTAEFGVVCETHLTDVYPEDAELTKRNGEVGP